MNDDTILKVMAGEDLETLFKERILDRVDELEKVVESLETRVQTLEEYQEPIRQIQDQIKKRIIQGIVVVILLSIAGIISAEVSGLINMVN